MNKCVSLVSMLWMSDVGLCEEIFCDGKLAWTLSGFTDWLTDGSVKSFPRFLHGVVLSVIHGMVEW